MASPKLKLVEAPLRTALYARFSSDVQKEQSIERQFADLEKVGPRHSLKLSQQHYYSDRAQSGASLFDRPGLTRDLMGAVKAGKIDVVLVEQTDRLSRSRADLFWLAEQFKFYGVRIYTPSGEVSDLQLTFEGHQNADFLSKLAARVKSGHDAVARKGLIPNAPAYGYDCVEREPGVKVINKDEAKIVRRIFTEYASGKSPRLIAGDLMTDKVPSPTGGKFWNYQSIVGGAGAKRGMLHNQLYVGVYLKNRFHNVKNPATGKTITRASDPADIITVDLPHLRIIDQKLWTAAHKLRAERGSKKVGKNLVQRSVVPRRQHLISGLLRCGECNERMIINFSDRNGKKGVCCSAAHGRQSCEHRKTYNLDKLTALAVDSMCSHLTDPEFIKEKTKAKAIEFARLEKENSGARQAAQKLLDRLNVQIAKLVRLTDEDEGDDLPAELLASLKEKQIERKGLEERLRLLGAENSVTTLHPTAIKSFSRSIETLHAKLKRDPEDQECRIALGNVIDTIIVHPTGFGLPYEISLYARLSAIMGVDLFPSETPTKQGSPRVLTQATVRHHARLDQNGQEPLLLLGRWKAAA